MSVKLWEIPTISDETKYGLTDKCRILKQRLTEISHAFNSVKLASSMAVEDLVMMDMIAQEGLNIHVFTLDTLKLNPETLQALAEFEDHYINLNITRYQPEQRAAEEYEEKYGNTAFYESVVLRKACCGIRKIEPLNRALQDAEAWLTGQRQEQSITRSTLHFKEHDAQRDMAKFNPIYDWSEEDVWAYILKFDVPYNQLYLQGYPSIGCEPCTRPIKQEEDIRAGRWWWENKDSKECGLHINEWRQSNND